MRRFQISPKRLPGLIRNYIGDFSHCNFFILVDGQDTNKEFKTLMNQVLRIFINPDFFFKVGALSSKAPGIV